MLYKFINLLRTTYMYKQICTLHALFIIGQTHHRLLTCITHCKSSGDPQQWCIFDSLSNRLALEYDTVKSKIFSTFLVTLYVTSFLLARLEAGGVGKCNGRLTP